MDQVTLNSDLCCDALVIPGAALEKCLREANESQLKIYLYLLRNGSANPTVSSIADYFNYSEQDVKRALRFWNIKGRTAKATDGGNIVELTPRAVYSKEKIEELSGKQEVKQLLFIAEKYMGRTLRSDEASTILYIYDGLGFGVDLVEYLLEYCISNNKKSLAVIESVAKEWKDSGVDGVESAKNLTRRIPKEMKAVMEALGFPKDRQPVEAEIAFVRRWTERYGYTMDVIGEACKRTVLSTGKPSIRYANGILKQWHDAGVKKSSDILALDEEFFRKNMENKAAAKSPRKTETKKASAGKFHNFTERQYDYGLLEKDLCNK